MKLKLKRELRDWGLIGLTFFLLYITGAYTEVAGFTQRLVLATGVVTPDVNRPDSEKEKAAYDFRLISFDGEGIDFETMRGKVVFINFWASWCAPCIAEMPNIEDLYQKYKDNPNIEFVLISLDQDREKAKKFIDRKDFSFPVYLPDYKTLIPSVYESPQIPTTFVLSRNGFIDTKKVGMANYNTSKFHRYLDRLLNQN